jgi:hypothetical protein
MQDVVRFQGFIQVDLMDSSLDDMCAFDHILRGPIMKIPRAVMLSGTVHGICDKGTIPEPTIAIGWKGRTGWICAAGTLIFQDDFDAALI